jgi:glutathionyl-hydroquinone reductase
MKNLSTILKEAHVNEASHKKEIQEALDLFEKMFKHLQKAKVDVYPPKFRKQIDEAHNTLMEMLKKIDKMENEDVGATYYLMDAILKKYVK